MGNTTSILITSNDNEDYKRIFNSLDGQTGLKIIGVENDETNAIIKSERLKPDVLILNLTRSVIDETELALIIHRRSPNTAIIMICGKNENKYVEKALKAGIRGYLLRDADMNNIFQAVKIVSLGGYYISASIKGNVINNITQDKRFPRQFSGQNETGPVFSFTERNIIEYIAKGFSDDEIAYYLHLSAGTIRNCITAIKQKTKMKSRVQAVVYSLVNGLITLE